MAFSALLSCDTPTTALRIRIVKICNEHSDQHAHEVNCWKRKHTTTGSTNAVQSSPSSNKAKKKETAADPRSMITSWSLNCSSMSCHMGVGGSSGRAVER